MEYSASSSSDRSPDWVQFEGPWTPEEQDVIVHEARSVTAPVASDAAPWIATKHVFPSFTLIMASYAQGGQVLTARGAQALAAQIHQYQSADALGRSSEQTEGADAVFQLVYQSMATEPLSRDDLGDLMRQARSKNERLGVTGVLVHARGLFLQVLEGDEETVRRLYGTIQDDPRHRDVETLLTTRVPHRVFPDWTMGLEDLSHADFPGDAAAITTFLQDGRPPTDREPLPAVARALSRFKDLMEPAVDSPSTGYRILVVEGSRVTQRLFQFIFDGEAHTIDMAETVDEALFKAEEHAYDAVVLNINLSERRTGVELLHAIHCMSHNENVPSVAVIAFPMEQQEAIFREVGFSAVVTKPVTKRALLRGIEEAIENPAPRNPSAAERYAGIAVPPLPSTIPRLLTLIAQGDAERSDYEKLIDILSRDQVLATWLIRTANSAFFNLSATVESVEAAIRYIGFRPACNLLLGRLLADRFAGFDSDRAEAVHKYIMRVSLGAAYMTRTLAEHLDHPHPEVAHSAVLMAQIGRLVLLDRHGDDYAELWYDDGTLAGPPPLGQETLALSTNYVSEGVKVANQHELSSTLLQVIRYHHQPAHARGVDHKLLAHLVALGLGTYVDMTGHSMRRLQRVLLNSHAMEGVMEQTGTGRRALMRAAHESLESARAFVDDVFV